MESQEMVLVENLRYDVGKYTIDNKFVLWGSKTRLTLIESKLLRLVIANIQLEKNRNDIPIYRITLPDLAKKLNINLRSLYTEIDGITDDLLSTAIFIKYDDGKNGFTTKKYNLFTTVLFNQHYLEIAVSNVIGVKNFFLQLKKNFTIYDGGIDIIMQYRSKYSITLYEALYASICRNPMLNKDYFSGKIVEIRYPHEQVRWFMSVGEKYKKISDFKKRVIAPAIVEINEFSNLFIDKYRVEKKWSSEFCDNTQHFIFYVHNKCKKSIEIGDYKKFFPDGLTTDSVIDYFKYTKTPYNSNQVKKIIQYYETAEDFIKDFEIATQNATKNVASYTIKMAENRKEKVIQKTENKDKNWDTKELKDKFCKIVDYWHECMVKIDMQRADASFNEDQDTFYNLKPVMSRDINLRYRRYYNELLNGGQTDEIIMNAIETAAVSSYFLRTSGKFLDFINPKNFYEIAKGNRDYDTQQVNLWRQNKK